MTHRVRRVKLSILTCLVLAGVASSCTTEGNEALSSHQEGLQPYGSCTVFHVAGDGEVLGGNNEDWSDPNTRFWIIPGTAENNGWIKFGYAGGYPQGGMNEAGLFWDATASPYLPMPHSEANKTRYDGPLMEKVMREAGSLDEASGIFGDYYCEDQYRAQYLVGDSAGASMIVEGDEILMKQGPFQVVTNFYQSHPELGGYPCWRHETATSMLSQAESVSPLLVGEVLDATHQEGKYPTQYSTIYDLRRRIVYLFYYHNFHEHVRIDLAEELRRGARHHDIAPLFSDLRPVAPVDGATIPGSSIGFRWTGKSTSAYQVCLSTSPDPTDSCTSIQPVIAGGTVRGGLRLPGTGLLLGLALLASVVWSRTRLVTVVAAVLIGAVAGCGNGATDPPGPTDDVVELRYEVAGLVPGATYYWKIVAQAPGAEFASQSMVLRFTTGG